MKPKYAAFSALDPFFEVVQRGLSGLVDGEHYFDTIAKGPRKNSFTFLREPKCSSSSAEWHDG